MSTATVNHLPRDAQQVVVSAECDGGASVRLPNLGPAIKVVPHESGLPLRAFEVTVPPAVRVLDLSRLPPAPWICVMGARNLEQLVLPPPSHSAGRKQPSGAELHLSLDAAPTLRVHGGVSALDACWPDVSTPPSGGLHMLRTRGPGRRPWDDLWLGEALPQEPIPTLILHRLPGETHIDLAHLAPIRGLELHGAALEHLQVGAVQQVTLEACPALSTASFDEVNRVVIRHCHALQQVGGKGGSLSLSGVRGTGPLEVRGAWSRIGLRNSTWSALEARGAECIHLQGDSHVKEVIGAPGHHLAITGLAVPHAPDAGTVEVQPAYIEVISRLLAEGRPIHPQVIKQWVAAAHGSSGIQDRLMTIAAGLDAGSLEPDVAWDLRCQLAFRGGEPCDVAGEPSWHWSFMADLADRGWAADLGIWWTCRDTVPAARGLDALVRRTHSMLALAALAEALQSTPSLGELLGAALVAPLPVVPRRRKWRGPYPHEEVDADVVFSRVVRGLVRARNQLDVAPLGDALARNLQTRIQHKQSLMGVLSSLHQLGVAKAADCLAELATDERLGAEVQREALVALLAAPHPNARPLLAHREASA